MTTIPPMKITSRWALCFEELRQRQSARSQRAVERLLNRDLIDPDNGSFLISDRFFVADTVIHEPRGLLRNADSTVNLVGTDAVLAVHNLPHCGQPLIQADGGAFQTASL